MPAKNETHGRLPCVSLLLHKSLDRNAVKIIVYHPFKLIPHGLCAAISGASTGQLPHTAVTAHGSKLALRQAQNFPYRNLTRLLKQTIASALALHALDYARFNQRRQYALKVFERNRLPRIYLAHGDILAAGMLGEIYHYSQGVAPPR